MVEATSEPPQLSHDCSLVLGEKVQGLIPPEQIEGGFEFRVGQRLDAGF